MIGLKWVSGFPRLRSFVLGLVTIVCSVQFVQGKVQDRVMKNKGMLVTQKVGSEGVPVCTGTNRHLTLSKMDWHKEVGKNAIQFLNCVQLLIGIIFFPWKKCEKEVRKNVAIPLLVLTPPVFCLLCRSFRWWKGEQNLVGVMIDSLVTFLKVGEGISTLAFLPASLPENWVEDNMASIVFVLGCVVLMGGVLANGIWEWLAKGLAGSTWDLHLDSWRGLVLRILFGSFGVRCYGILFWSFLPEYNAPNDSSNRLKDRLYLCLLLGIWCYFMGNMVGGLVVRGLQRSGDKDHRELGCLGRTGGMYIGLQSMLRNLKFALFLLCTLRKSARLYCEVPLVFLGFVSGWLYAVEYKKEHLE